MYGFRFKNDDIVECILDTNASTLSYIHRGNDLGVAFTELPDEVFPAVSLVSSWRIEKTDLAGLFR